jgi:hypothetical protein
MDLTKLMPWLFYNVVLSLLFPVVVVKGISWLLSKPNATPPKPTLAFFSIIKDGQVFFYCTALACVAIGDLSRVPQGFSTTYWVMGLLVIMLLSTGCFAVAANNKDVLEETKFGWCSVGTAVASILTVVEFRSRTGLL